MEEEISLEELLEVLKKRFGLFVVLGLIGLALSSVFSFFIATPEYSSTTQILVSRTKSGDDIQQSDINTNLQLINTYKDLIKGPVILDDVRETLDLNLSHTELSNKFNIGNQESSQVFSITVNDSNPFEAAAIANTTANIFQDKIGTIMNVNNVTIVSEAMPNTTPVSPNIPLNLVIGTMLGVMIGVMIAFVLEFMDKTIKDGDYIMEELEWTYLGSVAEMDGIELKPYQGFHAETESRNRLSSKTMLRKSRT